MCIPFHEGIKGNVMADEAAFLASRNILNNSMEKISSNNISTSIKNKTILS